MIRLGRLDHITFDGFLTDYSIAWEYGRFSFLLSWFSSVQYLRFIGGRLSSPLTRLAEQHYQSASLLASPVPFQFQNSLSFLISSQVSTFATSAYLQPTRRAVLSSALSLSLFQLSNHASLPLFFCWSTHLAVCFHALFLFCCAVLSDIPLAFTFASYLFPFLSDQGFLSLL